MTLRSQISPFLEDFRKANGKGSQANANVALTNIIEILLTHIEQKADRVTTFVGETRENVVALKDIGKTALLDAVEKLHDASYVLGADYTAMVDHLKGDQPDEPAKDAEPAKDDPTEPKRGPGRPRKNG
jgi:hypothetical protein